MTAPLDDAGSEMPAVSLAAVPGRVRSTLDLVGEIEGRGFSGIYCPGIGDTSLCLSIAHLTERIPFGACVQPIYLRPPGQVAETVAYIQEVSGGRFRYGIGVSQQAFHARMALPVGPPLADVRAYVDTMRATAARTGELPPIVLATLRDRMVDLAVEIGEGAVWANGSLSHMAHSLSLIPPERRLAGFFVGNMIPTVIDTDKDAARATLRRNLTMYLSFPNYRRYWRAAGFAEEMDAVEAALAAGDSSRLPGLLSDRLLADCTLFGTAEEVHEGVRRWRAAGVTTPILVPQSIRGGRDNAFKDLFDAFA
jgi:alkanesulfonate monooxygenase SsuD/methylene tetrahydromethanopterin reductase-like flavin-dependent oxidoreductase (luciferase family)